MIIHEEICVGCGRCQRYCPATAIRYNGLKSSIDQDVCFECGTCLRSARCPVDAISDSPDVFAYPRAVRKYFSDPIATHAATGIQGRGTEESKTNDVTRRCGPGEVGIAIEVGRPTLGMRLWDVQKITRALARAGIHKIEKHNPIHSMIADEATGDLKPELLEERILSAIIEMQVGWDELGGILRTIKEAAKEVDGVFCVDVFTVVGPRLRIPEEVLESIRAAGFTWRPNAKINMGLGRAWE
jgi:NAD-dependent dihydropyrimidine dehydrogenase PreA subunit